MFKKHWPGVGYISPEAMRGRKEAIGFIMSPKILKTDCARWEINLSLFQSTVKLCVCVCERVCV